MCVLNSAVFVAFFCVTLALYEDQVGKWDWLERHIGAVKLVNFGQATGGNLVVATDSNVLAALNPRNGRLIWRKLLEADGRGSVEAMSLRGYPVLVTGSSPPMLRSFYSANGALQWEMRLPFTPPPSFDRSQQHFIDADGMRVISVYASVDHVLISDFSYASQKVKTSPSISAKFIASAQCTLVGMEFYTCLHADGNHLSVASLKHNSQEFVTTDLAQLGVISSNNAIIQALPEGAFFTIKHNESTFLLEIPQTGPEVVHRFEGLSDLINFKTNGVIYHVAIRPSESSCRSLELLQPLSLMPLMQGDATSELCIPSVFSMVVRSLFITGLLRRDGGLSYRVIVTTADSAVAMFQREGRVVWSREEALSQVTNVEFVDLPLSDIEAQIEEEFTERATDIFTMFLKRVQSQILQIASYFEHRNKLSKNFGFVRDNFGFHKLLFMATSVGKFFLIDNLSGDILWSKYFPNMKPLFNGRYITATQRSTAHLPHPPIMTVIGRCTTGGFRLLSLNPITGHVHDEMLLPIAVTQVSILPPHPDDFLKRIIIFDEPEQKVVTYPSSTDYTHYLLSASRNGELKGFSIKQGIVQELWLARLALGSRIETVVVKGSENVHSQGRVLSDRSVLYKYINPNLAAVLAHSLQQPSIFVYLIDIVTGGIVYQAVHRKARGPVHVVHSENWLVYSFINEKMRRQEISAIDFYHGLSQPNSTFSSLTAPQPQVAHSTFILPDHIVFLKDTVTEKGITSKLILAANAQGNVLEIPKAMLDPRRPVNPTAAHREEGLIPYVPEIVVPAPSILNYNQTVGRIRGIETAPSGLESTCLVLVYGLDLYYTRVAPSQNFDILKDNFDHFLICGVLFGLILASYATKALAARKALRAAWK